MSNFDGFILKWVVNSSLPADEKYRVAVAAKADAELAASVHTVGTKQCSQTEMVQRDRECERVLHEYEGAVPEIEAEMKADQAKAQEAQ